MTRTTDIPTARSRSTRIVAGTIGLALSAAVLAPHAFGEPAGAGTDAAGPRAQQPAAVAAAEAPVPDITTERGLALAGTGTVHGRRVVVEVYGNDRHGSLATVLVEQPGGPDLVGHVAVATDDLLDGDVALDLPLDRATRGGLVATRTGAGLAGAWAVSGPAREVDETYEDAGYVIRTTGTNTPLDATVTVVVEGQQVAVEMHDAFAFDLTVTRTSLTDG